MSTRIKARVAAAICLLFLLWPAIHRVVVAVYGSSAWRLGGFAMYATPPARTRVSIVEKRGNKQVFRPDSDLPAAVRDLRRRFASRRGVLGSLAPPDSLAAAYLEALPDLDQIEVVIDRDMLNVSTALIERQQTRYRFDRSGGLHTREFER